MGYTESGIVTHSFNTSTYMLRQEDTINPGVNLDYVMSTKYAMVNTGTLS